IKASARGINIAIKEGMNVKIVTLPAEDDPDTFARRHSTAELKEYLQANSSDFIVFRTRLLAQESAKDPAKRAGLIKEIIDTIAVIPDRITRSVYVKECSRLMDISEEILWNSL